MYSCVVRPIAARVVLQSPSKAEDIVKPFSLILPSWDTQPKAKDYMLRWIRCQFINIIRVYATLTRTIAISMRPNTKIRISTVAVLGLCFCFRIRMYPLVWVEKVIKTNNWTWFCILTCTISWMHEHNCIKLSVGINIILAPIPAWSAV